MDKATPGVSQAEDAHSRSQTGSLRADLQALFGVTKFLFCFFFLFLINYKAFSHSEILCTNLDTLERAEEGHPWSGFPRLAS